jgi:hypothetical protein
MIRILVLSSILLLTSCSSSTSTDSNTDNVAERWSIPAEQIIDAGPGKDGIPALNYPDFVNADGSTLDSDLLVLGVQYKGTTKAYPHNVLDWHEVVNDRYDGETLILSYCPLTGSGMLWESNSSPENLTWGVSGLLYNSNLILYDRDTDSNWSQMLERSVQGERQDEIPVKLKVIEMTWGAWKKLYPDSKILSESTGFDRDYNTYPYLGFRNNENILFPISNIDNRLHPKTRVAGIRSDQNTSKVFQIDRFSNGIEVINTDFNGNPIVVIGSKDMRFGSIYSASTADGVTQTFEALQDQLPAVMRDQEGNLWDVFGRAVSGNRVGEELAKTESFTAYWFAWAAFYPNAEIYF